MGSIPVRVTKMPCHPKGWQGFLQPVPISDPAQAQRTPKPVKQNRLRMGSEHSDCRWQGTKASLRQQILRRSTAETVPVRVTAPHRIFLTPFWVAGLFATRINKRPGASAENSETRKTKSLAHGFGTFGLPVAARMPVCVSKSCVGAQRRLFPYGSPRTSEPSAAETVPVGVTM